MLRSMFSGVSGLRSHQTMIDVVGNNIANVNTTGYKASRVTFQESLVQTIRGATAAVPDPAGGGEEAYGGVNAFQLGLGSRAAAVDTVFTQGALQVTGRPTDLALQGDGWFVVRADGQDLFTRSGAFSFDAPDGDGNSRMVGASGEMLQGWAVTNLPATNPADPNIDPADPVFPDPMDDDSMQPIEINRADYTDIAIGTDGTITGRAADDGEQVVLGRIATARFANDNGLQRVGNSLFEVSPNAGNPGDLQIGPPTLDGRGSIQAGALEMSNVDLAQEFTNLILAQRGFQANSRTITASDEVLSDLVNLKR